MAVTDKIVWNIYAGVVGAVSTIVAKKLITKVWEASTGEEPPDPNDPEVPMTQAILWSLASGVGVGVTQLMMNRFVTRHWAKTTGMAAPGSRKNKLDW